MGVDNQDSSSTSSETDDSDDNDLLSQESNTLPWIGGIELLMLFSLASLGRNINVKD